MGIILGRIAVEGDAINAATQAALDNKVDAQSGTASNLTITGYTETVYALGTEIDPANGTVQTKTLQSNTTFTENLANGQSVILGITAGQYSVTWPTTRWAKVGGNGTAPLLTAAGTNWIVLWKVDGVLRGSFLGTA